MDHLAESILPVRDLVALGRDHGSELPRKRCPGLVTGTEHFTSVRHDIGPLETGFAVSPKPRAGDDRSLSKRHLVDDRAVLSGRTVYHLNVGQVGPSPP